jgi:hypothetical protein
VSEEAKMAKQNIPSELKPLAKFLEGEGFTLAIPFDNIRDIGYIGAFDDKGKEHIVDDGSCFENHGLKPHPPKKVVLGDFSKTSRFSIKSFAKVFGSFLGIDVGFEDAKSITLKFPKKFLQSKYYTEIEVEEVLPKLSPACRRNVANPDNFLITQTVETEAIEYVVELKQSLKADAQVDLTKAIQKKAKDVKMGVEVTWDSAKQYSLVASDPDTRLTVAYKSARVAVVPAMPTGDK